MNGAIVMRKFLSVTLVGLSVCTLGFLGACTDRLTVLDGDTEKPRDMAAPRPDLSGLDLSVSSDMNHSVDLAAVSDLAMANDLGGPADLSMPADLSAPSDLAMAMDMAAMDGGHMYSCRGTDAPGTTYKLVTNSLVMPKSSGTGTYAYDYDGDGKTENQFKTLVQVFAVAGLDLTTPINAAVTSGAYLELASVTTSDLMSATCAGVVLVPAKPTMSPPKFDGTDVLEKLAGPQSTLIGAISSGHLATKDSKNLLAAEDSPFELHMMIEGTSLVLPLHGVHIQGTVDTSSTPLRIRDGALHGIVAATDIETRIYPALATGITKLINGAPTSSTTMTIISLFENMSNPTTATKCMTPSLCCHTNPSTCVILPQEVKDSPIGGVLAPDVQVFDSGGAWKPIPGGKPANGMSFGFGFTAVAASFP